MLNIDMNNVGEQNLPSQNMLLWQKDYFKLVIFYKTVYVGKTVKMK